MNSLESKLLGNSAKSTVEKINVIDEVKLLLADNAAEERNLLKSMGLGNSIIIAEKEQEDIIVRTKAYDDYGRKIVHIDDINKLCKEYRMYMKKANQYMGTIPRELGAEMLTYTKQNNIAIANNDEFSRFFMIAPPKMFKGYRTGVQVVAEAWNEQKAVIKERIRARKEDPILIYQLPDNPEYYAVIKSWGNDFTPLRRLYGVLSTPRGVKWINFLSSAISMALIVWAMYTLTMMTFDSTTTETLGGNMGRFGIIVVDIVVFVLMLVWIISTDSASFRRRIMYKVTGRY